MGILARSVLGLAGLAVAGAVAGWYVSAPSTLSAGEVADLPEGDEARGERVFWSAGCASCHAAEGATGDDMLLLSGGVRLETDFGTFVAPNISTHAEDGIGGWSIESFANAMLKGVSPDGRHYYPAFPYASYARMSDGDIADLYAFMTTLPQVEGRAPPHEIGFPFSVRRGLGLWKQLYLSDEPVMALEDASDEVQRGQYLVEGPGHCGECHTPRNAIGGPDHARWLAGGPSAEGDGRVPDITQGGLAGWSQTDIALLLESGFTPEFDSVGGAMASVVRNAARLPAEDREAMAAYLKAIPASQAE